MATKRRKTTASKPKSSPGEAAFRAAMNDAITRDLCRHATERCIRAVYASQQLSDTQAARILIALECAAAILLYQSAEIKHAGQLTMPLGDVLNEITHDMLSMVDAKRIEDGEAMLMKAAKGDA